MKSTNLSLVFLDLPSCNHLSSGRSIEVFHGLYLKFEASEATRHLTGIPLTKLPLLRPLGLVPLLEPLKLIYQRRIETPTHSSTCTSRPVVLFGLLLAREFLALGECAHLLLGHIHLLVLQYGRQHDLLLDTCGTRLANTHLLVYVGFPLPLPLGVGVGCLQPGGCEYLWHVHQVRLPAGLAERVRHPTILYQPGEALLMQPLDEGDGR
mmetsp:Transcript_20718/g.50529  ORF Transcript_20718/g.50529 Transcript_20718/m.50529 type:complete len:209 (+) Transcript_20718:896-1522(+)